MKGKKLLTLLSVFAGAAVVGTTFAAWAVTDNADPFGIKVSPSQIQSDTTQYVTLSYGSRNFANVENLTAGVPQIAGSVKLLAETKDGTTFTGGVFEISIDHSSGSAAHLLQKSLAVDIYAGEIEIKSATDKGVTTYSVVNKGTDVAATKLGHVPPAAGDYDLDLPLEVPTGGKLISVVVSLDAATDAKDLEDMKNDVVYLKMDWNVSSTLEQITGHTIYLNHDLVAAGDEMYCYAWSATSKNAEFPGVKMADLGLGQYSYELKNTFDKFLFVERNSTNTETKWQTIDLQLHADITETAKCVFRPNAAAEASGDNQGKFGGAWEDKSTETLTKAYYVTSASKGNWKPSEAYGMTVDAQNANHYLAEGIQFNAGEAFKVCSQNRMEWFNNASTYDNCGYTIDTEGNVVVTAAGVYTVNLYKNGDNGNCVTLTKTGELPA